MFVRSTNGGASFSAPVRINDDATTNKWHWFGTFSVAPNGRLDAVWYDTRNDAGNFLSQLFYSYGTDAGVTWSPNVAVSAAFNTTEGWPQQNKIGDYITIVSDNTGGNVAYSATFNFNPTRGQHEQDVYYVRVAPSGTPTPTPTPTATPTPSPTPTATPTPTPPPTPTPLHLQHLRRPRPQHLHPRHPLSKSYSYTHSNANPDCHSDSNSSLRRRPHQLPHPMTLTMMADRTLCSITGAHAKRLSGTCTTTFLSAAPSVRFCRLAGV